MSDFDSKLAALLNDDPRFQSIVDQLEKAATAEVAYTDRTASGCTKCGCKHFRTVMIPDYKVKLAIIEWLANRGVGRPDVANQEEQDRIIFKRLVKLED